MSSSDFSAARFESMPDVSPRLLAAAAVRVRAECAGDELSQVLALLGLEDS